MPRGFFTVEEWKRPPKGKESQWIPILHLDSYQSLNKAIDALEKKARTGLFRVVQTQRTIWAEMEDGKIKRAKK
ncbi:MAG: hypothetical protein JWM68_5567 [Verrucomicrobiales bacterium]|nr:hypothetical protein [Verrucomicrobiales bacterium]